MGNGWSVRYPIQPGDLGLAIFADRSLDSWMADDGSPTDPVLARLHNITDAIFVPGLVPAAQQTDDPTDDLTVTNGQSQIRLQKNGHVEIKNNGQELVDLVKQLTDLVGTLHETLQSALVNTMMGPMPFLGVTQARLSRQLAQAQQIGQFLDILKG